MILRNLEELGNVGDSSGIIYVKPFRLWSRSCKWDNAIFGMRLCNAGEIIEIFQSLDNNLNQEAKDLKYKVEILMRSIIYINNIPVFIPKNLDSNDQEDYYYEIKNHLYNLEKVVFEHLFLTYKAIEDKQLRLLNDKYMCEICGVIEMSIPQDAIRFRYGIGEFIHLNCYENFYLKEKYEVDIIKDEIENNNNVDNENNILNNDNEQILNFESE